MITKRSAIGRRLPIAAAGPGHAAPRGGALQSAWSCPAASCPGRPMPSPTASTGAASSPARRWSAARSSRRPPTSSSGPRRAYAAVCSCQGQSCACGSLCCDGYTEFCCAIYGVNACPPGSLTGGWWKADGSSFCGGAARYYMDCHKPCGGCGCGGGGHLQRRAATAPPCGCGRGRCDHRKAGCTSFRYGNCNNQHRLHRSDPVPGRHLHRPVADRAQLLEQRRAHRQQHPSPQPALPPGGAARSTRWRATGTATARTGIGFYDNRNGRWTLRQTITAGTLPPVTYGRQAGDLPVVGDWNGDGADSIGIFRKGQWYLCDNRVGHGVHHAVTLRRARPATSPSSATGTATAPTASASSARAAAGTSATASTRPGPSDALPLRRSPATSPSSATGTATASTASASSAAASGTSNNALAGATDHDLAFGYGQPGDIPVVGDWIGLGRRQHRRLPAVRGRVVPPPTRSTDARHSTVRPSASPGWSGDARDRRLVVALGARRRPARRARGRAAALPRRDPAGPARPRASTSRTARRRPPAPRRPPSSRHAPMRTADGRARARARTRRSAPPPTSPAALPRGGAAHVAVARRRARHPARLPLHRVRHLRHVLGRARATRRRHARRRRHPRRDRHQRPRGGVPGRRRRPGARRASSP